MMFGCAQSMVTVLSRLWCTSKATLKLRNVHGNESNTTFRHEYKALFVIEKSVFPLFWGLYSDKKLPTTIAALSQPH